MKVTLSALQLLAVAGAVVVPDVETFAQIPIEPVHEESTSLWNKLPSLGKWTGRIRQPFKHVPETIGHPLDHALSKVEHKCRQHGKEQSPLDQFSWIEDELKRLEKEPQHPPHGPPPHGPPPHGPPPHGPPYGPPPPHRGRPGKKPHKKRPHKKPGWFHHPHHSKPNLTIYELISKSKYTTNLTKFIDDNKDIQEKLNSTSANFTLFAPTDFAFARIQKHIEKVPKEVVKKVLLYHVLPDVYPAFKLLYLRTAPTALESPKLGGNPQRVLVKFFGLLRGVRVNYYDKVIVPNIPAINGIIHATAAILLPPPPALEIITHLPGTFSTLELGLHKAGLFDALNTTGKDTVGGTLFAPTNGAFKKLGPRANAFLFSKYGEKFLKALLEYHVIPDRTLYSTAFYDGKKKSTQEFFAEQAPAKQGCMKHHDAQAQTAPYVHLDLPTLLGKPVAVDVIRRGPFLEIKINGFVRVAVQDGLAKDGVIQTIDRIIIPPKKPGAATEEERGYWSSEEIEVEELKERLLPYVEGSEFAELEQEGMKLDL